MSVRYPALGESMHQRAFVNSCIVLVAMLVGCATSPSSNNLPGLIATTTPCNVRLVPAWVGTANDTITTGFFATASDDARFRQLRHELRFDRFQYSEEPSPARFGARTISRSEGRNSVSAVHSY